MMKDKLKLSAYLAKEVGATFEREITQEDMLYILVKYEEQENEPVVR